MIYALPGMGADQRMYPAPWIRLAGFKAVDWTGVEATRTLPELAAAVVAKYGIRDDDALIGSSLGGMVAGEITKLRRIPRLFLVGSAVHPEEVNPWLAALHPLADLAPMDWLRVSAGKVPGELAAMFSDSDPVFVRAMLAAIFKWQGLGLTQTQVYRLHGRRDLVIPPPAKADLLLDGGHLVAMTHAKECTAFVALQLGL